MQYIVTFHDVQCSHRFFTQLVAGRWSDDSAVPALAGFWGKTEEGSGFDVFVPLTAVRFIEVYPNDDAPISS